MLACGRKHLPGGIKLYVILCTHYSLHFTSSAMIGSSKMTQIFYFAAIFNDQHITLKTFQGHCAQMIKTLDMNHLCCLTT